MRMEEEEMMEAEAARGRWWTIMRQSTNEAKQGLMLRCKKFGANFHDRAPSRLNEETLQELKEEI